MSNVVKMQVLGLEEFKRALRDLPKELHATAMRPAVSAAAGVVQRDARRRVPRDTGTLAKAVYRTRSRSASSSTRETVIVGVRSGRKYRKRGQDAWYWRFVEFGTVKMPARPFIRPAFETTKQQQIEAMIPRLKRGIERAAQKLKVRK